MTILRVVRPVCLAVVGLGSWGSNWMQSVISRVPTVLPVAWIDSDERAQKRAIDELRLPRGKVFENLEKALAAVPDIEAVLVTVPVEKHAAVIRQALEADKHVLVEKPFTDNILDARTLVALAQTRNRMLMVSQNYRYWSAPHVAQDIIHSNILGPVASAHVEFATHYSPKYRHFDLKWPILDISIHHFDLMRFVLADNAVEVCCRGWHEPHSRFAGFPAVGMLIRFAKGTTITYIGSLISHIETTWGGQWRIEGSDASMSMRFSAVHNRLDTIAIHRYNTTPEQVALPDMQYTDRTASLIKFAHWIRNGEPTKDVSTALDNLGSLSLMLAAHHSVEHGGEWTPVV